MNFILKPVAYVAVAVAVFAGGYFLGGAGRAPEAVPAKEVTVSAAPALDEERVRAIVEAYIKENPVVIMQSVNDYQQHGFTREIAAQAAPYRAVLEDTSGAPFIGAADAQVKIVEFFDYQCPHCKSNYPVLKRILEEDPTVVLLPKQLPILGDGSENDMSRFAALAALAAHRQGKFAAMHEGLMASPVPITRETVYAIAADGGIDVEQLRADIDSEAVRQELAESLSIAETTGFMQTGTPGYLIGGEVAIGAGTDAYDRLRGMIEKARNSQAGR